MRRDNVTEHGHLLPRGGVSDRYGKGIGDQLVDIDAGEGAEKGCELRLLLFIQV